MNKTELKNFAVNARRELLKQVSLRANLFGITEKTGLTIEERFGQLMINDNPYPTHMKLAFLSMQKQLEQKGYEQVLEEVAYTWFNRIIAIRYMEVHDYLPERVNVLSSSTGRVDPDILTEYETMELPIDISKVKNLLAGGDTEGAYRQLFIAQCNALNEILPFMFERIQDYTELLLPDYLLDKESIITVLVKNEGLRESFKEVEAIGWLYQFYNSEPKDNVFANLKKNKKIEKYDIPAATQLFTPKWIVQYMVENSLGQLWLEANPHSKLKEKMKYHVEPVEQSQDVKRNLEKIRYKNVNLEEISIIDPCVGSGHMLVYTFDLLYEMYEESGYPSKEIPKLILEKNLYGIDIDDRAAQLASFAVLMKGREKSRSILKQKIELNILSIQESNWLTDKMVENIADNNSEIQKLMYEIVDTFRDAKEYGSLLRPEPGDYQKLLQFLKQYINQPTNLFALDEKEAVEENLPALVKQSVILSKQYDIAITNPPYMGAKGMNGKLRSYVNHNFPNTKMDLFSVFIEHLSKLIKENGFSTLVTPTSWLFLSSFEKLRRTIVDHYQINSLLHMGRGIFGIDFGSTSFVIRKVSTKNYLGNYYRLHEKIFQYIEPNDISNIFLAAKKNSELKVEFSRYINGHPIPYNDQGILIYFKFDQKNFRNIPNSPIAYWLSEDLIKTFEQKTILDEVDVKSGLSTTDNESFLRYWFEVDYKRIGFNFSSVNQTLLKTNKKWFPYNKGGAYKKWYGNRDYIVNWEENGRDIKVAAKGASGGRIVNPEYYFKESITWSSISSGDISVRYSEEGFIFDSKGTSCFSEDSLEYTLGFINSKIAMLYFKILCPTLDYTPGSVGKAPLIIETKYKEEIEKIVSNNIAIAKLEWNSYEKSWDFKKHPFLLNSKLLKLKSIYEEWKDFTFSQFDQLKSNEEKLNEIFIDIYGLKNELTPEIDWKDVTIRKADLARDVRSFLSYFIGCMVGRYNLDMDGLAYAGGKWDNSIYYSFLPNKYGIVQFTDTEYFEQDIIARLRQFLTLVFSAETVEENMLWLAEALEIKKGESAEVRLRRYFMDEFFSDHCKVYQKRPIYWLVDSGKQKGLRSLIYMHRYQPDTMATIRFEHLQEIQAKYNNEIDAIDMRLVNPSLRPIEKRSLDKQRVGFKKRLEELLEFDKKLAKYANAQITINLDEGVVANYAKFGRVLGKIK